MNARALTAPTWLCLSLLWALLLPACAGHWDLQLEAARSQSPVQVLVRAENELGAASLSADQLDALLSAPPAEGADGEGSGVYSIFSLYPGQVIERSWPRTPGVELAVYLRFDDQRGVQRLPVPRRGLSRILVPGISP